MNARNFIYIRKYNSAQAKRLADNKIKTKELLIRNNIPTSKILTQFHNRGEIRQFLWKLPKKGFVIKPARGFGGQGIIAFKSWDGEMGVTASGKTYHKKQIESHLFDILDGAYSLQYLPDSAYIEEIIKPDPFFRKIAPIGLPDIRVIVFNKIPVMAMMRVPTKASDGKANLHMGALGIGVGLRSGVTLHAVYKNNLLTFIPDTKIRIEDIKIPDWDNILLLAAKTQAVTGLGFAGVDIVFDVEKGPLVLEVNARPGLSIQIANKSSLRTRLERLENIDVPTPERGVELAKNLFAQTLEQQDIVPRVLSVIEDVVFDIGGMQKKVRAKIDTGAYRTSLDQRLVKDFGFMPLERKILVKAASGQQFRPVVRIKFTLGGKMVSTNATIAERSHLRYPLIVGRRNLKGFLINPAIPLSKEDKVEESII